MAVPFFLEVQDETETKMDGMRCRPLLHGGISDRCETHTETVFGGVKSMKRSLKRIWKIAFAGVLCLAMLLPMSVWAAEGTEGTEMQVVQPEQLEIQLGPEWVGVEFQLKTDAGLYPGTIPVGDDGILKLEIGGSSSYVLSCMNSSIPAPAPEDPQALATTEEDAQEPDTGDSDETSQPSEEAPDDESQSEEKTVGGIPVSHLVMFGGGMVLAVGTLVGMYIAKRRRKYDDADDDADEEDY